jgi:uncharacterized OB-fold protein
MTTTAEYTKPLPDADDPDMRPFWAATRDGRLTAPRCRACGRLRWPPTPVCGACLSEDTDWVDVSSHGTIWSYAVYHRAFHPGFRAEVPYVVAVVEVPDGPHFVGNLVGARDGLAVGAQVTAVLEAVTPEMNLVKWRLAQ